MTQPILWRPGMMVDGGIIDADHRHLIDIVNSFAHHRAQGRAVLTHAEDCLNSLKFYATTHFAREERLQVLVGYPERQQQRSEHDKLATAVDDMIWRVQRTLNDQDAVALADELALLLRRWLLNHILAHDLRMRPYAAAMRSHAGDLKPLRSVPRTSP
jgi:hemerythrin